MKNEIKIEELGKALSSMKYQLDDSFTEAVMQQLPDETAGRRSKILPLFAKSLVIAAAAIVVLVLGVTFALEGSLNYESLLGLENFSELDIYDAIQYGTYEN